MSKKLLTERKWPLFAVMTQEPLVFDEELDSSVDLRELVSAVRTLQAWMETKTKVCSPEVAEVAELIRTETERLVGSRRRCALIAIDAVLAMVHTTIAGLGIDIPGDVGVYDSTVLILQDRSLMTYVGAALSTAGGGFFHEDVHLKRLNRTESFLKKLEAAVFPDGDNEVTYTYGEWDEVAEAASEWVPGICELQAYFPARANALTAPLGFPARVLVQYPDDGEFALTLAENSRRVARLVEETAKVEGQVEIDWLATAIRTRLISDHVSSLEQTRYNQFYLTANDSDSYVEPPMRALQVAATHLQWHDSNADTQPGALAPWLDFATFRGLSDSQINESLGFARELVSSLR